MSRPICYDLYCGLGGWAEGFLSEGFRCIGYDIEKHDYGTGTYPGELILCDARSIHGSQLADAACIVASPPCQEPSMRAQPWKRSRALHPTEVQLPEPDWWKIPEKTTQKMRGMTAEELRQWRAWQKRYPRPEPSLFIELFNACFRIQREASEAAGRHIPMIVENVVGAQRWVGRARWHFGSYYLWGDVPALMPVTLRSEKIPGQDWNRHAETGETSPHWRMQKNDGGSWFNVAHNTTSGKGQNPDGRKLGTAAYQPGAEIPEGTGKTSWFFGNTKHELRGTSSGSKKRKAASAEIAKIPFPLAQHIARTFRPKIEAVLA